MRVVMGCVALAAACSFSPGRLGSGDASIMGDSERTDSPLPPCVGGACRYKALTVDAANVSGGPHAMFPMLVHLASDGELASHARPDGFDIGFSSADGTVPLAYERQKFDSQTGELIAWVAIPSLDAASDTVLRMYYGDPNATADAQNPAAVWDASMQGAWHLDEATGGTGSLRDSTTHANHATADNGPALGTAGKIGRAVTLNAASTDDRVRMPDSPSLDSTATAGTFELWIKWTDAAVAGRYQRVMISSNVFAGTMRGYELSSQPDGDHYFYPCEGQDAACPGSNYNLGPNPFTNQTWHHLAVTFDWATKSVIIYVDGAPIALTETNVPANWTTQAAPDDWLWGSTPNASGYFAGSIDEIRISNVVRSPQWLATEHANQNAPSTFYALGPEMVSQ